MEPINTNSSLHASLSPSINTAFMVMIFLSVLTVITNALILVAFFTERKLQTYANQYIVNIAISDLLVGLVCMPLRGTIALYEQGWAFGNVLGILFYGFQNIVLSVSVFGVIAICFDRYIATFYPIKHYKGKSKRKAFIANISTWIISLSIWVPLNIMWDLLQPSNKAGNSGYPMFNILYHTEANIAVAFVRFFGPFLIISILYLKIYLRLRVTGSKHLIKKFEKQVEHDKNSRSTQFGSSALKQPEKVQNNSEDIGDTSFSEFSSKNNDGNDTVTTNEHVSVISFKETLKPAAYATTEGSPAVSEGPRFRAGECVKKGDSVSSEAENTSKPPGSFKMNNPSLREPPSNFNVKKGMRTMSFVVLAFFITWLPNCVNITIAFASPKFYLTISTFTEVARWATFLNSLLNPIGYAMAQPLFRQTIVRILKRSQI